MYKSQKPLILRSGACPFIKGTKAILLTKGKLAGTLYRSEYMTLYCCIPSSEDSAEIALRAFCSAPGRFFMTIKNMKKARPD
jgi:hypothetical protein